MQFKNPEVFYLLFVLLIPVIVHLFQLQKFKKIAFTNVEFLKQISLDTRKSSRLKKYLILASRIIGLLSLLFVFSQPYSSNKKSSEIAHHTIYFDNSLSLKAQGKKGELLRTNAQEIIENIKENDLFTLITNDNIYRKISAEGLKNELKNIKKSSNSLKFDEILLKINSENTNSTNSLNKRILLSDFQNVNNYKFTNVNTDLHLIKVNPEIKNNISIDSVAVKNHSSDNLDITVTIRNQGVAKNDIPISLSNNETLISKHSFSIEQNQTKEIEFSIPKEREFNGILQITYSDTFEFDNSFLFTLNPSKKINVLHIGESAKNESKIFTQIDFNFTSTPLQQVNYNELKNQHFIILNQLNTIPQILASAIEDYLSNDGHLLIIPHPDININTYNNLLSRVTQGRVQSKKIDSLDIRTIHYDHPLFNDVFTKKVDNFQFPYVTSRYTNTITGSSIISYENNEAFLKKASSKTGHLYWFSSSLNPSQGNFYNSPLIVPTLYNMGVQSMKLPNLYYNLGRENTIEVNYKPEQDQVIEFKQENNSFIPLQQIKQNKTSIITNELPNTNGFYELVNQSDYIQTLAFNHPKNESNLNYLDIEDIENEHITIHDSIDALFSEINEENEVVWLWKLFLGLTIVSLLFEILILKFFKT